MRKTKASTIEEENKPKDEIKEEGSSKKAAKMLNRAIDSSDVTKAGAPDQPFVFSCRHERRVISTMAVERGKLLPQHMKGKPKRSKMWRSTRLNILRSKQKCFEDNEISRVADTTKTTHQLSAKAIEEHGTNKGRGYIQTIHSL